MPNSDAPLPIDGPIQHNGSNYRWYVLIMLTIMYTFNFIDRQILVILQEPIKAELGLTDTHLGLLTGLAFAALYVILGIPIARYADLNNRKNVVAISLAVWSAMTIVSGRAMNFMQLFLARIGVGIGEAGGSPPAHSIISDYFPPEKRATALSIYSTGIYIGIFLGYIVGGVIAKYYGWRMAFYALGIPGVLFAVLVYYTVKEPIKGMSDPKTVELGKDTIPTPSIGEVVKSLLGKKTFVFAALAAGFHTFTTYGVGNFLPSFLQRVHGVDIATAGIVLGLTTGAGGFIGTFLGGYLADKLRHRDMRWYLWVPLLAGLANIIPSVILFLSGNGQLAMVMTFFTGSLTAFFLGPTIAVTHSLVGPKMRAFASSILFFILNLIGLGFGPLVVGYISDVLTPQFGNESLRYAFLATLIAGVISMIFTLLAAQNYRKDLAATEL